MKIHIRKHNLNGRTFGKWKVIREIGRSKNGRDILWLCQCECERQSNVKASYLANGYSKQCDYCNKHSKKYYETNSVPEQFWKQILRNSKKRSIKINISPEDAYKKFQDQRGQCALSGILLEFPKYAGDWKNKQNLPSLDRIDNNHGYEIDNIQWIHKDVNRMKNTHDQNYFIDICKKISNLVAVDKHHK